MNSVASLEVPCLIMSGHDFFTLFFSLFILQVLCVCILWLPFSGLMEILSVQMSRPLYMYLVRVLFLCSFSSVCFVLFLKVAILFSPLINLFFHFIARPVPPPPGPPSSTPYSLLFSSERMETHTRYPPILAYQVSAGLGISSLTEAWQGSLGRGMTSTDRKWL